MSETSTRRKPRAAATFRAARRNAVLRGEGKDGEVREIWRSRFYFPRHHANYLHLMHPPVRPNARDRSDAGVMARANKIAARILARFMRLFRAA